MTPRFRQQRSVTVVAIAVAAVLAVLLSGCGIVEGVRGRQVSTVGEVEFSQQLVIPPLAESTVDGQGRRVFDLTVQAGQSEFAPGQSTDTWGMNGDYLGPTLRARRGEHVQINLRNALDEITTMHWHGMHLPAEADGGPHQQIDPGGTWSPGLQIDQPAATLWYHPHPHGEAETHVYRGLAGMFILDDDVEAGLDLPRGYGVEFSDDRDFALIGTDGGLLTEPHRTDRIRLSPGERAEIVLTMQPDEDLVLRSYPPELGADGTTNRQAGGEDSFDVLELRAGAILESSPPVPDRLIDIPRLDPGDASETRQFELRSRTINGEELDMNRIDEVVTVGSSEIWEVENGHGQIYNFHIHDVQFQVLDIDGESPPPELAGWKDTVFLPPRTTIRLIMRFTDYADPSTPYMYHCHLLRHEDRGLMGQFVVVEPGQEPVLPNHGQAGYGHGRRH